MHTLHAVLVTASSQPCIDQLLIPGKTNEMASLSEFVERLVKSYGTETLFEVVSVDAGMTSAANARFISRADLRYVMAVKDNQPTLLSEIQRQCGFGKHKQVQYIRTATTPWENYRGKSVRRELYRSNEIAAWPEWETAKQAWRVKQTTRNADGNLSIENRYFITNLPKDRLSAREILMLVRLHWGVENGCHWTMDVILGEDERVWCTKGKALRMLSWMRLLAYNILRMLKDRYLRSPKSRTMPWDDIRRYIVQALLDANTWTKTQTGGVNQATL
jgi:predicted transposase YbfD/YdcC